MMSSNATSSLISLCDSSCPVNNLDMARYRQLPSPIVCKGALSSSKAGWYFVNIWVEIISTSLARNLVSLMLISALWYSRSLISFFAAASRADLLPLALESLKGQSLCIARFFLCVCVLNGTVEFLYALMLDNLRVRIEIIAQTKIPTSLCYAQSHQSLRSLHIACR